MTNPLTRWERYSPVTLGMETIFNRLDALQDNAAVNYPPYNIIKTGENSQSLEIALAGFTREEVEVATERGVLTVSARRAGSDDREYTHKGLALRPFARNWQLADDTVIDAVTYQDGLLTIALRKEVPEAQKRKVLDIN